MPRTLPTGRTTTTLTVHRMAGETLLLEAGVMFATLALAGTLGRAVGQSVIPFYLIGGMVVSPFVLGELLGVAIPERQFITVLAELGIVFLLFFLGLEFSLERLLSNKDRIMAAGTLDLIVNFPMGVFLGLMLGWSLVEAFVLGGIVYISSSAIITKSLIDLGWTANAESEPMLGTLVYEDLFIAVYLAVLSAILLGGGSLRTVAVDVGIAVGFLLALVALVYFGTSGFERFLAVDSKELFVIRAVAVTVLVAGAALALGISEAVAAFFIGMGFSGTDHVHTLSDLLSPVRDVFAAAFFFWIGLTTNPLLVAAVAVPLAVTVALTTPTKLLSGFLSGRIYALDRRRSVRVATGMVTRGEFSLIITALAATAGGTTVLVDTLPALTVGYVLIMSTLGSTLMQHADTLNRVLPRRATPERV